MPQVDFWRHHSGEFLPVVSGSAADLEADSALVWRIGGGLDHLHAVFSNGRCWWAICMRMLLTRYLPPYRQAVVHAVLILASIAVLPILPNATWQPKPGEDPTWKVLAVLATSVGLPYTLLSATSPLLQSWYAARQNGGLPYRYFALSNAGSMAALLVLSDRD